MRKMMLVPRKNYGPGANCIGNAPGPVKCNKCGKCGKCNKCGKYNKYSKCSKCSKCAYLAVPHSSSPGGEQAGGKASTIDPGRGCTLVRATPACGHQTGFSSLRRKLPRTAQETTPACGHQTGFSSLRRKLPRTAPETTPACGHQTGFSRLRRKLPRTAPETTPSCDSVGGACLRAPDRIQQAAQEVTTNCAGDDASLRKATTK